MEALLKIQDRVSSARNDLNDLRGLTMPSKLVKQKFDSARTTLTEVETALLALNKEGEATSTRALQDELGDISFNEGTSAEEMDAKFQKVLKVFMETFSRTMKHRNIENYLEVKGMIKGDQRPVILTLQWVDGLSPVEKYTKHLAELRAELEASQAVQRSVTIQLESLKARIEEAPLAVRLALQWPTGGKGPCDYPLERGPCGDDGQWEPSLCGYRCNPHVRYR